MPTLPDEQAVDLGWSLRGVHGDRAADGVALGGGVLKKCDFKNFDAAVMPPISGWTKFRKRAHQKKGRKNTKNTDFTDTFSFTINALHVTEARAGPRLGGWVGGRTSLNEYSVSNENFPPNLQYFKT